MKSYIFLSSCIVTIIFYTPIQAQYYRDRTKFIHLDNSYPANDFQVFDMYPEEGKYSLTLHEVFNEPEIMVDFNDNKYPLVFDFGNRGNLVITTALNDSVKYSITDTVNTYTHDGKIIGQVLNIDIASFILFGQTFQNEKATMMDWSMTSSASYNGLVGLNYLKGKCFTLSYQKKEIAISTKTIIPRLPADSYCSIPLETYNYHPYGVHFRGSVNGRDAIIYFDTGRSITQINRNLVLSNRIVSDKSGDYYEGTVNIVFGTLSFDIYFPRISEPRLIKESNLPVGIQVGSDILRYLLITIDRTNNQNLLIIHK